MSARKKNKIVYLIALFCLLAGIAVSAANTSSPPYSPLTPSLARDTLAKQLGWVESPEENNCGGYYLEQPFLYPVNIEKRSAIEITSNQGILAQRGTSTLEGQVTALRNGQQLTGNKAYVYRDPVTWKLTAMDVIGDVHMREPNTLVVAKQGHYDFVTGKKSLLKIFYRTALVGRQIEGPNVTQEQMEKERKITSLTAWGKAYELSQAQPKVYELLQASYSTCPPVNPAWRVKASHIVLDKNTGRGYATNARILVKNVPVFYTPYINFPLDKRRKSGFLWPIYGGSSRTGASIYVPYYMNMAPNYDMTVTPGYLRFRGFRLTDSFRYLTPISDGIVNVSVLPSDKLFSTFQKSNKENPPNPPPGQDPNITKAEVNRLLNDSVTRKAFYWRDDSRYDKHWSSHVDFNYAGDDYYLRDFGSNLNEISNNQLLQEGDLYYKGQNWNFTGRMQSYQTVHPFDDPFVQNNYRRLPQLLLNGDYPDQALGLEYFVNSDVTHFNILKDPGVTIEKPIGNRLHVQPGVSLPLSGSAYFITPRFQVALTDYNLYERADTHTPAGKHRAVPIFDIVSGLSFTRDANLFGHGFEQTLEPQIYYTYIPYRNQSSIPNFDTTVNTLTYDQIFNYNRFTGIDRIGDANQIGLGVTTRLIDQETGIEKVRLGVGDIVYFDRRRVTLCNSKLICTDYPQNPENHRRLSPVSGLLNYSVNPAWGLGANTLWNPITKQLDTATIILHYQPQEQRIINLGFTFARGQDPLSGVVTPEPSNNLKVTDASFAWPLINDLSLVGRWSQNWNHKRLQNLLYGLQYDTCCWAARFVGGRAFVGLDPTNNNKAKYSNGFYFQFSLKGLGDFGTGNPNGLLSSISGYKPQFGQEF